MFRALWQFEYTKHLFYFVEQYKVSNIKNHRNHGTHRKANLPIFRSLVFKPMVCFSGNLKLIEKNYQADQF